MDKPKVFVVSPYYMYVVGEVVDYQYRVGNPEVFIPGHFGDAFLARNFNNCLATALNTQKEFGWTHLLMVHADVKPYVDDWGTILLHEMHRTGADFLSVVLPIKSVHGVTSTAVEDPEGRIRMLTMSEIDALPHVSFDAPLAGFLNCKLLCSTGLWLLKLDPWVRETDDKGRLKLYFEVRDRIVTKKQDGEEDQFERETLPEDWHFSRLLHARGKKLMSTRRIPCGHIGISEYSNVGAWGTMKESRWDGPFDWVND